MVYPATQTNSRERKKNRLNNVHEKDSISTKSSGDHNARGNAHNGGRRTQCARHDPSPALLFLKALTRSATRLIALPNTHLLYGPTRHCLKRTAKRHSSPINVLFQTTHIKVKSYETILPARRRRDYELLANVHIDNNRTTAITNAKAITRPAAFTDGPGLDEKIGAIVVLMLNDTVLCSLHYHLGKETEHTVYKAEITAVILALHLLMQIEQDLRKVTIGVDNQAILLGLKNQCSKPSHYLLDKVHDALEDFQVKQVRNRGHTVEGYRVGRGRTELEDGTRGWKNWNLKRWCKVNFIWVPGHEGIDGNEKADEEAKQAVEQGSSPHRQLPAFLCRKGLPISVSATRQVLKSDIKKRWKAEWKVSL